MVLKYCLMILTCCVYDFERLFNEFEMNLNDLSRCSNNFGSQKTHKGGGFRGSQKLHVGNLGLTKNYFVFF